MVLTEDGNVHPDPLGRPEPDGDLPVPGARRPPADPTPIAIDEEVSGTIAIPGEEDRFTFDGTAGQRLFFDVEENGG